MNQESKKVNLTDLQKKVKYVIDNNPNVKGSNTELYIAFIDTALKVRSLYPLSEEVKELMRTYKPESITRARRAFIEPTDGQKEEEQNYITNYRK